VGFTQTQSAKKIQTGGAGQISGQGRRAGEGIGDVASALL
jgi:hypothetical protein